MPNHTSSDNLLRALPDPQTVRERIGISLREARLLRQLLCLVQRVCAEEHIQQHGGRDER